MIFNTREDKSRPQGYCYLNFRINIEIGHNFKALKFIKIQDGKAASLASPGHLGMLEGYGSIYT